MSLTSDDDPARGGSPDALSFDSTFDAVTIEQWQEVAERSLGENGSLASLTRHSIDGIRVSPLYYDRPGHAAVAESVSANPVHWDNRLQVLGNDLTDARAHLTAGLEGGVQSFSLELDALGVSDETTAEMALEMTLDGVYLDLAPVHLVPGESFVTSTEALLSLFEKRNYESTLLDGSVGADPFSNALLHNASRTHYQQSLESMAQLVKTNCVRYPGLRYARIDVTSHHNAGASPVLEIVAAISMGSDYLDALLDAGVALESALAALSFSVACDADLISNIVKLRSLKRLWAHTVSQLPEVSRHAGINELNLAAHIEAHTSHRMLSRLDPWVNHLRNVTATSAAAIAGTDSITVHPHNLIDGQRIDDDAELADRVARNLPIILAEESLLKSVVDPAAGSYAIEHLTQEMSSLAWQASGDLQRRGGLLSAVRDGDWIDELAASHQQRVQRLIDLKDLKIGVNHQRPGNAPALDLGAISEMTSADRATSGTALPRLRESSVFEREIA